MNRVCGILLLTGCVSMPVLGFGQAPASVSTTADGLTATVPVDQQASTEQMTRFFEVMQMREKLRLAILMPPAQIMQRLKQKSETLSSKMGAQLTPEQKTAISRMQEKYFVRANTVYPEDARMADLIPIYQRYLTRDEVTSMIAFYSTPAGQHMLSLQSVLAAESTAELMVHAQERMETVTDKMVEEMTAYLQTQQKHIQPAAK